MMDKEQQAIGRRKILDQGMKMMDAIKANSPLGEDDPRFWAAMQVTVENVSAFDERNGISTPKR